MRRTKIITTIGPATSDPAMMEKLIMAGSDIVRINCSHANHDTIATIIQQTRKISQKIDRAIGVLLDLAGPKIRTGKMAGGIYPELKAGQKFVLTNRPVQGSSEMVSTNYAALCREVHAGDTVMLDNGLIELRVLETSDQDVVCEVATGGVLKDKKGINLPGVRLSLPPLREKDQGDLTFGLAQGVDFVALSFVQGPDDIRVLKKVIGNHWPPPLVIAKLEKPHLLEHLYEIIDVADGIMIARGDLGVELPAESVPAMQKTIIKKANAKGKPVITATQMLDSMIEHPRPTRAEASDVANAIYDGTDAIMLSGETAVGAYPIEAVQMMDRIACAAEASMDFSRLKEHDMSTSAHAVAHAGCDMAIDMKASAIACFSKSGASARWISQFRPPNRIIALVQDAHVYNQLTLNWGVTPIMLTDVMESEATMTLVEETLLAKGIVRPGEMLVITGGLPIAARGPTNFVKLSKLSSADTGKSPVSKW